MTGRGRDFAIGFMMCFAALGAVAAILIAVFMM